MTEKSGRPVGRSPGWEGEYQGGFFSGRRAWYIHNYFLVKNSPGWFFGLH